MTIKERVEKILKDKSYMFIGIKFDIYDTDYIRIYDKVNGKCLYTSTFNKCFEIPEELFNKEFKKSELIKLPKDKLFTKKQSDFAICFYLDAPDMIEKPINMGVRYN